MTETRLPGAIGRYQPLSILGQGAMGIVYKAHDPVIDRTVAIKVMQTNALDPDTRDEFLARFRQEVQAAGRCVHPSIVAVYDYADDSDGPFIVMEFVEGRTLREAMQGPDGLAGLDPLVLTIQVLDGLAFAHMRAVIHRDIKPANIMVTPGGTAKIMDFGIARLSGGDLTQAGGMIGTPRYMAPEQVTGQLVDHRADLFAVGCVLYEMLAGQPPFVGRTVTETIYRLTGPEPASLEPVEAAGHPGVAPVLRRALAKRPDERFASAQEFAAALASVQEGGAGADATVVASGSRPHMPGARSWDPGLASLLERNLARYIGPMARVAVERAMTASQTTEDLLRRVSAHLDDRQDRAAFLRSVAAGRLEPSLSTAAARRPAPTQTFTPATAPGATLPPGAASSPGPRATPLGPEALHAAQTALTIVMGPVARVLVRQAAAEAASAEDFLSRLVAHVADPKAATALRRRLEAEVRPLILARR